MPNTVTRGRGIFGEVQAERALLGGTDLPVMMGNKWYVSKQGNDSASGRTWNKSKLTIQAAINAMAARDWLFIGPGAYDETVTIAATKSNITLVGSGGRGAAFIEPTTAGAEGMQVKASDVTLVNLGVAGDDTGDYALNVNGNTTSKNGKRFRAYHCKFEKATGGTGANCAVLLDGDANYNVSDALFEDCEFAWSANGILFDDSSYGYPTQIFVQRSKFHNISTAHIGLAASGGVVNLHVTDCVFDVDEAAAAPTNFIKVNRAGDSGIISGCRFALATNSNKNVVAAGVLWSANATEAGWSTARPTGS